MGATCNSWIKATVYRVGHTLSKIIILYEIQTDVFHSFIVFWPGVLVTDIVPQSRHMSVWRRINKFFCLNCVIRNKQHGIMFILSIVLIHENAHPNTAATMHHHLMTFGWKEFYNSSYNTDLTLSDVFQHLKSLLFAYDSTKMR